MTRTINAATVGILAAASLLSACGANETILKSGKETPLPVSNATVARSTIDSEIDALRTADFRFIWILRRKDGGVIDTADKKIIKANTVDMNRRVSADDGKAFLIGTNALPPKKNLDALYAHFAVEDLSPAPQVPTDANSTSNTNK
ncbi:MAG TPA: hypothetical protein VGO43_07395 [Pyrinomonadaceae bacterium]|nr:hypothetical protein [Pyrinomonadaceae bacterium]